MTASRFDITLNGVQLRVNRTIEGTKGYRKGFQRQLVQVQSLSGGGSQSRSEQGGFYQSSWVQGSRWEVPIVQPPIQSTYEIASNMDAFFKAGRIIPSNKANMVADTNLHIDTPIIMWNRDLYAIGDTNTTNASFKDVYKWTPASDAWVRETAYHSGVPNGVTAIWGAVADPRTDDVYVLGDAIMYSFDPASPANGAVVLNTALTYYEGSDVFVHDDRLFVWNADKLYEITDPQGSPALSAAVANDGKGVDLLSTLAANATDPVVEPQWLSTILATADGIYYVKNVLGKGQPVPWVFRIDRDSSGTDISTPIGTLNEGLLAVGLTWHQGSLIISATPDWQRFLDNDNSAAGHCRIEFDHFTIGQQGVLGVPLGEALDETPFMFLGSEGTHMYFAGQKRVWVYEAGIGGLHPYLEDVAPANKGPFHARGRAKNSSGEEIQVILGSQRYMVVKDRENDDPDTVVNFGDDLTHYLLDSGYLDFGFPHEDKTLTSLAVETDSLDANQEYRVYVSVDDGAFTLRATHTNAKYSETDLSATAITGKRFRYRVIYQTKNTVRAAFRSLLFKAEVGVMVPVWFLSVDGTEFRNVENKRLDPEQTYDAMETLGITKTPVTLIDNYRSYRTSDTNTTRVKVMSCEIFKSDPNEAEIHLQLVGV